MVAGPEAGLAMRRTSFWRRNRWIVVVGGALLVAVAALAIVVAVLARRAEPYVRARIVQGLEQRFHSRVELDSFSLSVRNGLEGHWGVWAEGKGLRIWPPANVVGVAVPGPPQTQVADSRPLIELEDFRFHAPLIYEPGKPFHISVVELQGLDVDLPPKSHFEHASSGAAPLQLPEPPKPGVESGGDILRFGVDSIDCGNARLVLETSKPGKLPLHIAIAHFKLTGIGSSRAMGFQAELTNPRPTGAINTTGSFGPWNHDDPGESPIDGNYRFDRADLSDFKGIAGILSSTGHYEGTLRNLTVDGQTDTPDFRLRPFDNPLALHTKFHAKVDGTNGDTWLQPVDATLGRSHFSAQGQVVRVLVPSPGSTGQKQSLGHDIALKVNVDKARIEDFLRLATHTETPMLTGSVTAKATLHIPPGPAPVHERLQLNGSFVLDKAQFSSARIQADIEQLSLRGLGRPGDVKKAGPAGVDSRMEGDFVMRGGVINLPALTYTVPGATIQLTGAYGIEGGALNFTGSAKMQATVSQMVGGWKGLLLKPLDRYLKKDGAGTEIPIHVRGTREQPDFGIDFNRMNGNPAKQPEEQK
jgi:hypothetical protein